jgi:hypothetical protein
MRVRRLELRLIALGLTALWTLSAGLVLLGYRPGGPLDLVVGLAGLPFALIALAGLVWPPVPRPGGPFLIAVALGVGAGLVLIPSIGGVVRQLAAGGPQTLLPSLEAAYPWALALLATAIFAGIGLARRLFGPTAPRERRLATGAVLGVSAALVAGGVFGAAAIANEVALADQPVSGSRYGPTGGAGDPQPCPDPLALPASADLEGELGGTIDGASIGEVAIDGPRDGDDFRWEGIVASDLTLGRYGATRIGDEAWTAEPRRSWEAAPVATVEDLDLDRRFVRVALSAELTAIGQDLGLAVVGGARARHCRIATDGATVGHALPVARWIVGDSDIGRWRGEIDYYVFLDGAVGIARGSVNGEAFVLDRPGILGTLAFELRILDRGRDLAVAPPA